MQALLPRFRAAHTQVLGVSVDSVYCHVNWARDLGGITFPLLADFHPKGEVARAYGLYLDGSGITDRATVLVDAAGVVRDAASVTPSGRRDIGELAAECERLDAGYSGPVEDFSEPAVTGCKGGREPECHRFRSPSQPAFHKGFGQGTGRGHRDPSSPPTRLRCTGP